MYSKSNNPENFVRAINGNSCSVACVLSICYDSGVIVKQSEFDDIILNNFNYREHFPHWDKSEYFGVLNEKDIIKLAEVLSLVEPNSSKLIQKVSKECLAEYFNAETTLGVLILTKKDQNSKPWQHCFKLAEVNEDLFYLMNPSTRNIQIEKYNWDEISLFEPDCIVFEKTKLRL